MDSYETNFSSSFLFRVPFSSFSIFQGNQIRFTLRSVGNTVVKVAAPVWVTVLNIRLSSSKKRNELNAVNSRSSLGNTSLIESKLLEVFQFSQRGKQLFLTSIIKFTLSQL